jgi:Ca2+-binding EF-hand superfamily protein/dienelactone hydrolase
MEEFAPGNNPRNRKRIVTATGVASSPEVTRPPGTLVGSEDLPESLWPEGCSAGYRVWYQGVGYDGSGQLVTGSLFVPRGAPPVDGWPVISYAHGTTGLGNVGAPSVAGLARLERAHVAGWLAEGYLVAATDYEGLSTPGPHPYFNGEAVADDVIDIVRAVRQHRHRVSPRWWVVGFSQGGHAALFTALIATRYAPELNFLGTIALAPPTDVRGVFDVLTADGAAAVSPLTPITLAGLRVSHPHFRGATLLSIEGQELLTRAETASLVEMFRACRELSNDTIGATRMTARIAELERLLDACRVPLAALDRPVFLGTGGADEIVPASLVEGFATASRNLGTDLRSRTYPAVDHASVLQAAQADAIGWAREVLARPLIPADVRDAGRGFRLLDHTGDGYLTRDDYDAFALRLIQAFGEPPGSIKARAVREGYRALWQAVAEYADTDDDDRVSEAEFLSWLVESENADPGRGERFERDITTLATAVLDLVDTDHDGIISTAEMLHLLSGYDIPRTTAEDIFDRLDSDQDGAITTQEIIAAIRDFCLDPAPDKPGHWMFGQF